MLDRLLKDHEELRELSDKLVGLLESVDILDDQKLAMCRWTLTRKLLQHLALEERFVFGPLMQGNEAERDVAIQSRKELEAFFASFMSHMQRWSGGISANDLPEYRSNVITLVRTFNARITVEERSLYPLVRRYQAATLGLPMGRNWAGEAWPLRAAIHGETHTGLEEKLRG